MSRSKGSGLIDYAIPTAIVGLVVGLGLYNFISGGSLLKFLTASGNMTQGSSSSTWVVNPSSTSANTPAPGDLGGSQNDPQIRCQNNLCTIDFGDYILTGIPENFRDYFESSASSGGTDLLADLLKQIADNANVDEATKKLLQDLANNGHGLAGIERDLETFSRNCASTAGYGSACVSSIDLFIQQSEAINNGSEKGNFNTILGQINQSLQNSTDPEDINTLAVVNILSQEILNITQEINTSCDNIDPNNLQSNLSNLNAIILPDGSNRSDLNSVIICHTGDGQDPGYQCN